MQGVGPEVLGFRVQGMTLASAAACTNYLAWSMVLAPSDTTTGWGRMGRRASLITRMLVL